MSRKYSQLLVLKDFYILITVAEKVEEPMLNGPGNTGYIFAKFYT
jgi:hypothetical protein